MKTVAPAFAEMRTAIQESKTDVVSEDAAKLKPAFTQTETIWNNLGQSPAAAWAREAQAQRLPALVAALQSEDSQEGVAAFRDKRAPVWKGR